MQKIIPMLWFDDEAEDAVAFYVSIFKDAGIDDVMRYGAGGPGPAGAVMTIDFRLEGQDFIALNGFRPVQRSLAIGLFVSCESQAELDALWDKLAEGGEILQCGWVRDTYGFSWNIVPRGMGEYLGGDDPAGRERAMQAMLQMEKLDVDALRRAYEGV